MLSSIIDAFKVPDLRNKPEASGHSPKLVETVRGWGYRFKK